MLSLQKLPSVLLRHKVIHFLCKKGLVDNPAEATFNDGARAYVDLSDPEPRNVFLKGVFDPDFFPVAQAMLPPEGVCFDIGANIGLCAFGLLPTRPSARYHLFEANIRLVELLEKSFALHPDASFTLNRACVTDQPGHTRFYLETTQSGQSHVATEDEAGDTVPNLVLDEYLAARNLSEVHFAKMDLEGHELPALQGWRKCLAEYRIKAIYIEIMPENQARYGRPPNAPLYYLESLGYNLYLCKKEDFGSFGDAPNKTKLRNGYLPLSRFRAKEYPEDFATDALALAPS